jgi:hypothetical protein
MIEEFLFDKLLLASLYCEIRLSKGDLLLARITILGDEIGSIACEMKIRSWSPSGTFYRSR